jgi:hypothetical protein
MVLGLVGWFPQEYANVLFAGKAMLGVIAVILLITHMNQHWCCISSLAQRMRYITLLAYAVLVTGGSAEQVAEAELVSYRHLGSVLVTLLLVVAMTLSLLERHNHPKSDS